MKPPTNTRGKGWAYTGALVGGGISIAANVAHSFVPPATAAADWRPQPGAVIGSMFWPILLFVAVEILARVMWPKGFWWGALRFGGLLPVAAVAGLVSYRHLSALLIFYGEDATISVLGPLAVDGLMVMATAALLVTSKKPISIGKSGDSTPQPATTVRNIPSEKAHSDAETASTPTKPAVPSHLLNIARYAVEDHTYTTGQPIRAEELASRINIDTTTAQDLLNQIGIEQRQNHEPVLNGVVNGSVIGGDRS
jgi:hypothetical protein